MKVINERAAPPSQADAPSTSGTPTAASNPAESASSPQQEGSKASDPKEDADLHDKFQYVCFLMQCLSELLLSYDACKVAFLSYSPNKQTQTPAKETSHNRFRTATLHLFFTDLVTSGTLNPQPRAKLRSRMMLCDWAITVIISLSSRKNNAEVPAHVSKTMLEKNFVSTLTTALSELDLN
ncbi:hypothetical protein EST38_g7812 [Candolleomyces aberdarensis]|uniref:Uncharacterized protein n=1 Tax=Candolleomyces aberdarensis TaxID=2316362 RepID=A0A4Q2DEQ9_9AGAR|nr:hypothetical protein EST38_g7812 [Candolleomyces aberdarensis]